MKKTIFVLLACAVAVFATAYPSSTTYEAPAIVPEPVPAIAQEPERATLRPELVPICACESSYEGTRYGTPQHFEKDGVTVRYGRVNPDDRGMCQLNAQYHREAALLMGLDIETEDGNIRYANHLYETQGSQPWSWSKPCHGQ